MDGEGSHIHNSSDFNRRNRLWGFLLQGIEFVVTGLIAEKWMSRGIRRKRFFLEKLSINHRNGILMKIHSHGAEKSLEERLASILPSWQMMRIEKNTPFDTNQFRSLRHLAKNYSTTNNYYNTHLIQIETNQRWCDPFSCFSSFRYARPGFLQSETSWSEKLEPVFVLSPPNPIEIVKQTHAGRTFTMQIALWIVSFRHDLLLASG